MINYPMTVKDWLRMLWFVLRAKPEQCPTCKRKW